MTTSAVQKALVKVGCLGGASCSRFMPVVNNHEVSWSGLTSTLMFEKGVSDNLALTQFSCSLES